MVPKIVQTIAHVVLANALLAMLAHCLHIMPICGKFNQNRNLLKSTNYLCFVKQGKEQDEEVTYYAAVPKPMQCLSTFVEVCWCTWCQKYNGQRFTNQAYGHVIGVMCHKIGEIGGIILR